MYAYLAEEFATELINVRSDTELDGALKQVSRRLGFDHFARERDEFVNPVPGETDDGPVTGSSPVSYTHLTLPTKA